MTMFELVKRALAAEEGKALPAHPALISEDSGTVYSPGATRTKATLSQREASRHQDAYGGDQAIDWVMDCVDLYGDTASNADFHLEKDGKRIAWGPQEDGEKVNPILKLLLENPNPYMDWTELIHLLVTDLLLVGNAYWFKFRTNAQGQPLALYRLAPSHVKIVPDRWGPSRYEYQPPGATEPLNLKLTDVMHFKRPNPHSAYYGLGVIQGGGRPFDVELALTETQAAYYENKADPSLVVSTDRRIPRDVFNKLKAQLRARNSGPRNSGELLVLEAGLKADALSTSASDALFEQLTVLSRDRILAMFRVSPLLLGIADASSGGSTKLPDAQRQFDNKTVKPLLKRLQTKITRELVAAWDYQFKFDHRYNMPEEDLVKLSTDFASLPGVKVKEVRAFAGPLGIEPSTGDDEIDEMVLNLPGEEHDENGQPVKGDAAIADRNLPREAGRPPKGENTRAFPRNGGSLPPGSNVRRGSKAFDVDDALSRLAAVPAGKAVPNFEEPARATVGRKLPDEQRPADPNAPDRDAAVDQIATTARVELADAATVLERGLLDHVEGKAFEPNSLVKRIKASEAWKSFVTLTAAALEKASVSAISSAVIQSGETPEDNLDYTAIARGIVYRTDGVTGIAESLKREIVQKVAKAIEDGAERPDVDRTIRESIDFWRATQAETVALTEAVHAYNEGMLTALEAAGHTEVAVTDGHDDDQPCIDADGSVWDIDHARENRLEHPRCRRAFLPVPEVA